nr:hypothetical protein [Nostoc sp. ChiSLP01]
MWGVWGERGERFFHHPPTPPTLSACPIPIPNSYYLLAEKYPLIVHIYLIKHRN